MKESDIVGDESTAHSVEAETPEQSGKEKDQVAYDTYKRVLSEKKKRDQELLELKTKLDSFEKEHKSRRDEELKSQKKFEELLRIREAEKSELESKLKEREERERTAIKLSRFLGSVDGEVPKQYWSLIELDRIQIDEESGLPDEASLEAARRDFMTLYPEVIRKKTSVRVPQDAPQGSGVKLSYEEWLKLPTKEKKLKLNDIIKP